MKLKKVTEDVYYLTNPVNIGVIKTDQGVILIDSGLDDNTARKIIKTLEKEGLFPLALINTHSHADHCGGNKYLKKKTGLLTYAPAGERELVENTLYEPLSLFSGAYPPADLQNKFLMAQPSGINETIAPERKTKYIAGIDVGIVPLPGHALNQIGITYQGVLFCADTLFAPEVLEKYPLPFHIDIARQKESLNRLLNSNYDYYLPAHGDLTENIDRQVNLNLEAIKKIEDYILHLLAHKRTTEELLKEVFAYFKISIKDIQAYYLNKTAVLAYLSYLKNREQIETEISNNILYWVKI